MNEILTNEYREFLDDLRESGTINMFGAPRELQTVFGIDRAEARAIFTEWTKTFEEDK